MRRALMTAIYVEGMLEQARSVDGFFSAYPSVLNCLTNSRYIIFVLLTGTYITSYLIVAITCNIFLSPIVMQGALSVAITWCPLIP